MNILIISNSPPYTEALPNFYHGLIYVLTWSSFQIRVLSLGEASSGYLVTTAENELGVVIARSEISGVKMIPVSWTEMQCPKTYNKEQRKIAKVIPEDLAEIPESS